MLEDGTCFTGKSFGYEAPTAGEVVFNTAMTGYPESLTDPSYEGQILVTTYPILGNYGVPPETIKDDVSEYLESSRIHCRAIIAQDYSWEPSHWLSTRSLHQWLRDEKITGLYGIDTRALTKHLRDKGSMLGKIYFESPDEVEFSDPNSENLIAQVSCPAPEEHGDGDKTVVLVDCGTKFNIIRCLTRRGVKVVRVPWNYDFNTIQCDGLFISNGPGNPDFAEETVENIRKFMATGKPICGICMGNQLLAKAAGANTYKLKYGHRSRQSARAHGRYQHLLHHIAEPRLCRRRLEAPFRLGASVHQHERRHQRGHPPQGKALVLGTVPSRGFVGTERHRVHLRQIHRDALTLTRPLLPPHLILIHTFIHTIFPHGKDTESSSSG